MNEPSTVPITADVVDSLLVRAAMATLAECLTEAVAVKHYGADPGAQWLKETQEELEAYLRDVFLGFELATVGERLAADFMNALEQVRPYVPEDPAAVENPDFRDVAAALDDDDGRDSFFGDR